jgi:hypothetical protein
MLYHTHLANILPIPASLHSKSTPKKALKKRFPNLALKTHTDQEILQLTSFFDHTEVAIDEQTWQKLPILVQHVVSAFVSLQYFAETVCEELFRHREQLSRKAQSTITHWTLESVKALLSQHRLTILMLCQTQDYEKLEACFYQVARDILPLGIALHTLVEELSTELLEKVSWEYCDLSTFDGKNDVLGDFIFTIQNLGYFCLYLTCTPSNVLQRMANPLLITTTDFTGTVDIFCQQFSEKFQIRISPSKAKDVYCECLGNSSGYQAVKPLLFVEDAYYTPNKTLLNRVTKDLLSFSRQNPDTLHALDDSFISSLPATLEYGMKLNDHSTLSTELMVQLVNVKLSHHVFPLIQPNKTLSLIAKNSAADRIPDKVVEQACLLLISLILAKPVAK